MSLINNTGDNTLSSNLKTILPNCNKIDSPVGYFFVFKDLYNELKSKQTRILASMDIDNFEFERFLKHCLSK